MALDQQQQKPEVVQSTTTTKTSDGLLRAITGDIVAGLVSATCVALAVTIIDRVIIEKTARRYCVIPGLRTYIHSAFKNPRLFILGQPFRYVWALYAPTFAAANVAETLATPISDSAAKIAAVLGVLTINVPLGIWKDIKFSQLYGLPLTGNSTAVSSAASKMRMKGTSVFLVRDAVTVFSSFAVAPCSWGSAFKSRGFALYGARTGTIFIYAIASPGPRLYGGARFFVASC
ncbi:unnamed protein product [Clonostachys solani]|uniref:Uncharacterized protein n=1 Tax=Clonostachys solani TaxID=160281 RepID=A0A9N9W9E2_9HYPO|nr:unnamed protein product [Clonostachys solani]